jgi:hypothetical protein
VLHKSVASVDRLWVLCLHHVVHKCAVINVCPLAPALLPLPAPLQ